jgi:DNA-binding transcriptional MocR family regulator
VLFHPDRGGENAFRLTFIRESEDRIAEGIATLGRIIKKQMRRRPTVTAEQKTKDVWI